MTYQPPKLTPLPIKKAGVTSKTYPDTTKVGVTQTTKAKNTVVAAAPVEKTAAQTALEQMIAEQLTDRRFAPVTHESLTKSVTFVTAANGLFKVTKTPVALFKEQLETFKTNIVGLPEMEIGVELAIPKIPMKYLIQALSFYRDVNEQDKTEASTLFFWNAEDKPLPVLPGLSSDGKLVIYCPIQVNSATLSDFSKDDNVAWLRSNMALLFELHSHNTMDAFFSGTDDANENMTQFYGVWGRVTSEEPAFIFRYVAGNSKIVSDPSMLFEWPKVVYKSSTVVTENIQLLGDTSFIDIDTSSTTHSRVLEPVVAEKSAEIVKGPFKMLDYPEDWMAQHTAPKWTATQYGAGFGNTYGKQAGNQMDLLGYEDAYGYGAYSGSTGGYWDDGYDTRQWNETTKKFQSVDQSAETERLSVDELETLLDDAVTVSTGGVQTISVQTESEFTDIIREVVLVEEDIAEFEI